MIIEEMKIKLRPRCYFDINIGHSPAGRIIFELYNDLCPKTVENFIKLCKGECGIGQTTHKELHYKNTNFHRVIKGFMIQGGDFSSGDGAGGESVYGGRFEDENLDIPLDRPFLLCMANCGPNTNGSQFFIITKPAPHLNQKHVVFGHVFSGENLIESIENLPVNNVNKPIVDATIAASGELIPVRKKKVKKDKSSSSKEKKNKKSKKRKHKNKKTKIKTDVEELNPNCSVRPDEIPEVPKPFYLYRGSLKEDTKIKEIEDSVENLNEFQSSKYTSKDTVGRSGRIIKGRGQLRYLSNSPRNRSETPPHWKKESQFDIEPNYNRRTQDNDNNHKRSFSRSSNGSRTELNDDQDRKFCDNEIKRHKKVREDNSTLVANNKLLKKIEEKKSYSPSRTRKNDLFNSSNEVRQKNDNKLEEINKSKRHRNGSNNSMQRREEPKRNRSNDYKHIKNVEKKNISPFKFVPKNEEKLQKEKGVSSLDVSHKKLQRNEETQHKQKTEIFHRNDGFLQSESIEKDIPHSQDKVYKDKDKTKTNIHTEMIKNSEFDKHEKIIFDYGEESDDSMVPRKKDKKYVSKNITPFSENVAIQKEINNEKRLNNSNKDVVNNDSVTNISDLTKKKEVPRKTSIHRHSRSKSPINEKKDTRSPPAHLVAKWQNRRDKIMTRRSPISRINEKNNSRSKHSTRRYSSKYSNSPSPLPPTRTAKHLSSRHHSPLHHKEIISTSKTDRGNKFTENRDRRSSSGTVDSSPSSDGSSVSNRPSRIDSDLSDTERNVNTQCWIIDNNNRQPADDEDHNVIVTKHGDAASSTAMKSSDQLMKTVMMEKANEVLKVDEVKCGLEDKEVNSVSETLMVIKPIDKPKLLNQWKTEDDDREKRQSSILAKLRESDEQQKSVTNKVEIKPVTPAISQSISKYRSQSSVRSAIVTKKRSTYSSSSRSSSRSHHGRRSRSKSSDYRSRGRANRYHYRDLRRRSTSGGGGRRGQRRRYSRSRSRSYSSSSSSINNRRRYSSRSRSRSSRYGRIRPKRSSPYRGAGFTSRR